MAGRPIGHQSTIAEPTDYDAVEGQWARDQLIRMDEQFRDRVERAIANGKEHTSRERPRP
jgi:hypothetical protein